ncbi:Alpha/Beta hydrolase protein [Suillus paluster]|uniref:Alpha/Beta hydrolase protein n=1 Tax=Suillus paluster TaxID=48578 RepID=UPI001B868868|nr:Alpha/Beta hydrolase protein [Suillus paluster]KAG1732243.1 Alpha/Beta hydrolase protein [Suillus paluster]
MSIKAKLLSLSQALLALEALSSPATTTSAPTIDLGYAQYQGSVDTVTNITSFLGIRYAAAPVGNFRWAAPQPPSTILGVQQATTQPNACYQATAGNSSTNPFESASMRKRAISQSEDCLFLNVYTPGSEVVATPSGGLPVVVWIHGGGYIKGAASPYDGADLIMESNHGVITVLVQYRLGLFGFLPGEAVKEGGALNAGLLDQNYALQWVQAYICSFGGDPTKVTIWGESAALFITLVISGAGSVLQHLVAHGGNTQPPLFRAAITSSTFLPSQYNYHDRIPEMLYSEVVDGTNCSSSSDTLSCLRAADVNTLQTLNYNINIDGFFGTWVFVPVVDGTFIVERPTVTISKGRLNANYLLAVTNSHEGNVFVNQSTTLDIADYVQTLFPNFGSAQVAGAVMMYQNQGSNVNQANLVMGESIFVCPTYYLLKAFGEQAWKASSRKGEFAIPPGLHAQDVVYYFTSGGPSYNNSQFITAFSNSFMAMTMYETPDDRYTPGDITPSWNSWRQGLTEMMFNETSAGVPDVYTFKTDMALLERCA